MFVTTEARKSSSKIQYFAIKMEGNEQLGFDPSSRKIAQIEQIYGRPITVLQNTFEKTSVLPLDAKSDFDEVSQGTAN